MAVTSWKFELFGASHSDRSPGHGSFHSHSKDLARNSNFSTGQSAGEDSTAQENKWMSSSNPDETRNESSGTNSQDKKSVNFEKSTTSSLKSSTDKKSREEAGSKGDQMATKRLALANRIQLRKNSKSLLRAKSVEFSFNSSSTDGSIFDYEKAVSRARLNQEQVNAAEQNMNAAIRTRPMQRANEDQRNFHVGPDDQPHDEQVKDYQREATTPFVRGDRINRDKYPFYEEQGPNFEISNYEEYPGEEENQLLSENNEEEEEDEDDIPRSHERYIGLSFRPLPKYKNIPKYHSMENLIQADLSVAEEEFESGIDTMDHGHLDPYDLVVKKIKDISASDLPNFEKLKRVSTLIANSSMTRGENLQQQQNSVKKFQFSTWDLRERGLTEHLNVHTGGGGNQYRVPQFSENPVDAVVRMKQNLAKSMEELSTYQLSMMSDEGGKTFSKLELPSSSKTHNRFLTEMKFQPNYYTDLQRTHKPLLDESAQHENYASHSMKHHSDSLEYPTKKSPPDTNEAQPGSDTQTRKDLSPIKKRRNQVHSYSGLEEKGATFHPGFPNAMDNDWQQGRKSSRPTSIGHIAGRTFISPSFLRPATSMRNINTHGNDNLTFDLMKTMDLDSEDMVNSFEDNLTIDNSNYDKDRVEFPDEQDQNDDQNYNQSMKESNTHSTQTGVHTRKFSSFDQTATNYNDPPIYPHRPWSISTDAYVFPVFGPGLPQPHLKVPELDVDRLNSEAEMACLDQEEVANSLRKTQQILEEEEKRRHSGSEHLDLGNAESSNSFPQRLLTQSESIDNGYGSWASKLISAPSTSSDGADLDNAVHNKTWMTSKRASVEPVRKSADGGNLGQSSQIHSSFDKTQEQF